jgi:CheY-like chemotaxis protein
MNPSPDVGVDILRQVRERKVCRRGSAAPLPVVVMTAFGKDKVLSAEFLQQRGACDYVQKPFGDGRALKKKIELALCDEGTFSAPSRNTIKSVQLRFSPPSDKIVRVERFEYSGAHYDLLVALRDLFVPDLQVLQAPESFRGMRSLELADKWKIEDDAVRRRVSTFREKVARDFREGLNRVLEENDIVENLRKRDGYRLNPLVVKVVAWEQEMAAQPRRR